ncbi:MAG TPA: trigger factor [Pirellulaceae bacterium]|nr:trigger factor [Pirellulaceae bacterium]HMO93097.1 trigger factor [Pirellulaceae bacterium]HMP69952.1 trigger factor [Pirellulaceae bacterium]
MNTELENDDVDVAGEKQKLNLEVKIDVVSACERHVTVTVSREDIDRYFKDKFDEIAPKAEVPGFRLGRAPRALLENKFRKQIANQVKGALLMDSFTQINEQETFSAISEPDFDFELVTLPDEGPFIFEFNIEVRPDFELPEYKGIALKKYNEPDFEIRVNQAIDGLMEEFGDFEPVDDTIQLGDLISVNITSSFDGKTLASQSEIDFIVKQSLLLSDARVDNFADKIVGARANDIVNLEAIVGDSVENTELQGKKLQIVVEILDVKRLDRTDTSQLLSMFNSASIEDFRATLTEVQQQRFGYDQRQFVREQISQLLTESANWALPADLLRRQSRRELERKVLEMRGSGFTDAQIRAQENFLRQNALVKTEMMLKEHFVLERIAEIEKIEETDEDYEMEINKIAIQRGDSPRRVRASIERNGQMDALRNMIIEQKVVDLIIENAKINFVDPPQKTDADLDNATAVEFFATGKTEANIPEAKYDNEAVTTLPKVDSSKS